VQALGTAVALITTAVPGRLDLGSLPPLVVARDRDEVRAGVERRSPHRVVRGAAAARLPVRVASGLPGVVSRADGRRAQDSCGSRLCAQPLELPAMVDDDVV